MLEHHRDLRADRVRDRLPARAGPERERLWRRRLEWCGEQRHGLDVRVEHELVFRGQRHA